MKAWILRALGLVGMSLFATLFVFTWAAPTWVEDTARDFITAEVRKQVSTRIEGLDGAKGGEALARASAALQRENERRVEALKAELTSAREVLITDALARIRDVHCDCRSAFAMMSVFGHQALSPLDGAGPRLTEFVQMKYLHVVAELKSDLRIFSATNAAACLLLLILSFARPRAVDHLVLPGLLLAAAVTISSYFYLFEQNWFFTLIHSDYVGFTYLGYLGMIFGLLLDIFLNRARVTTRLGNWGLNIVGSAFSLTPC